jgi:thiol:disulfide interchange protein DsbC
MSLHRKVLVMGATTLFALAAHADEASIRKNLASRLPNLPKIDEVTPGPMPGLWEVRMGSELIYSDAKGSFVIQGEIIDTNKHLNLTEERVAKLTAIDFARLPLQDAVVWKRGTGARKVVVFADPNCSFCKRFERDLNTVRDITVYTFLFPILGGDSPEKSRAIWCARDNGKVWRDWMVNGIAPPAAAPGCNAAALDRNVALGHKHGVSGTPSLVFENSERVPGVLSPEELEKKFAALRSKARS